MKHKPKGKTKGNRKVKASKRERMQEKQLLRMGQWDELEFELSPAEYVKTQEADRAWS